MAEDHLVSGLGGLFFRSKDPEMMADWYEKHFGINSMKTGYIWNQEAGPTVFSPFKQDTDYFGNPQQMFMLNFRVTNMEALLEKLKAAGVRIDEKHQEDEEMGKFAWVYDPEGNKIELWQPPKEKDESK